MISLIYMYNEAVNLFNYETTKYLGITFIILVAIFLIFNVFVVLLHRIYNVDIENSLKNYFVDVNDIDFTNKKIFEMACLRESRLPCKRDVYTILFGLVNKKYLIISKEYEDYYIEKTKNLNIDNLSNPEKMLLDLIEDEKVNLKLFIKEISNKYSAKKIVNEMKEEIFEKFDYFVVNNYLGMIFSFFKILILGTFGLFCIYVLFILGKGDESLYTNKLVNTTSIITYLDVAFLIVVFIFILTYFFGYIQKINDFIYNREDAGKFLFINGIILISFFILFLINKFIAVFLIYIYITALILNLDHKKYFMNVKNGYLKEKIEAISLEKYISEYSNLKERDSQSVIVYEEYFTYAYAFGITLKVNDELDLTNVLFYEVMKQNLKQNMSIFSYLGEYIGIANTNNTTNFDRL